MKIVEWNFEKIKKLKPNYNSFIRVAIQTDKNIIYLAKIDPTSGDISGKFGLIFDEKIDFDYKKIPNGWKMYLIYSDFFEYVYKADQENLANKIESIPNKESGKDNTFRKNKTCFKCEGSGFFTEYHHISDGVCFVCNGRGYLE